MRTIRLENGLVAEDTRHIQTGVVVRNNFGRYMRVEYNSNNQQVFITVYSTYVPNSSMDKFLEEFIEYKKSVELINTFLSLA